MMPFLALSGEQGYRRAPCMISRGACESRRLPAGRQVVNGTFHAHTAAQIAQGYHAPMVPARGFRPEDFQATASVAAILREVLMGDSMHAARTQLGAEGLALHCLQMSAIACRL
eukprot:5018284-Pyramimonas_sp.AAC.2